MKEKILFFIVGLLLGAIISTGSIYFYTVANNSNKDFETQIGGGNQPSMQDGQNRQPPEMPNENNSQSSSN